MYLLSKFFRTKNYDSFLLRLAQYYYKRQFKTNIQKMRKQIDIKDELIPELSKLAAKEMRRGKRDVKNFIEDLIEDYIIKNK